ncbi:hypothetical protein Dip518_000668 [Parelusimicrobium proximum]|uniref:hypothetical protein n=1 Tax=Parelusimicrobium proximum TaxID=3228953 RepID=UPI003D184676
MKKIVAAVLCVFMVAACAVKKSGTAVQTQTARTYQVSLIYNGDTGYFWYLDNAAFLKMAKLKDEKRVKGASEATKLGNPHTQVFIFELINPEIKEEKAVFKFKHYLEKDEAHLEAVRDFKLNAVDFK